MRTFSNPFGIYLTYAITTMQCYAFCQGKIKRGMMWTSFPSSRCKSSTDPTGGTVSLTARVSTVRWNLKEAGGKIPAWRTETAYKAYGCWMSLQYKTKSDTVRSNRSKCSRYMGWKLLFLTGEVSQTCGNGVWSTVEIRFTVRSQPRS